MKTLRVKNRKISWKTQRCASKIEKVVKTVLIVTWRELLLVILWEKCKQCWKISSTISQIVLRVTSFFVKCTIFSKNKSEIHIGSDHEASNVMTVIQLFLKNKNNLIRHTYWITSITSYLKERVPSIVTFVIEAFLKNQMWRDRKNWSKQCFLVPNSNEYIIKRAVSLMTIRVATLVAKGLLINHNELF